MSPDLPVHFRELTPEEPTTLGAALDDGFVVVSAELRNQIKKGAKALAKARRRQANQSRKRNHRK